MKHCPFIMKVNSNDPFLEALIKDGTLHKIDQKEFNDIYIKSKDQIQTVTVKEPKFNINIENAKIITLDGEEIDLIDLYKSK